MDYNKKQTKIMTPTQADVDWAVDVIKKAWDMGQIIEGIPEQTRHSDKWRKIW